MGYLDYSGLSHFLDKLKTIFVPLSQKGANNGVATLDNTGKVPASQLDFGEMTGATSSTAGTKGLTPAPAAGKNVQYLKGDATWDSPAMSELALNVVDGKINITYQKEVD